MKTINLSVKYNDIDESIIPDLLPQVIELIKSGVSYLVYLV